jgi:hypothetical protein
LLKSNNRLSTAGDELAKFFNTIHFIRPIPFTTNGKLLRVVNAGRHGARSYLQSHPVKIGLRTDFISAARALLKRRMVSEAMNASQLFSRGDESR